MAISSNASYIPTANEFLAHWASVDAFLGAGSPMVLPVNPGIIPAGFNRSGLVVLRDTLQANLDTVQEELNDVEIARGGIRLLKVALMRRLSLFIEVVVGYYAVTEFIDAKPRMPNEGDGEESFLRPMKDAKSLWVKLNAEPAPAGLTLPITVNVGTNEVPELVNVAQFTAMVTELQVAYEGVAQAEQDLRLARAVRDKTMRSIYAVLLSYRTAVLPRIAGNEPLIETLPRLTPEPGHTPDAVNASAVFEAPDAARVVHSESEDADFKEYQLRGAVGDDADTEDAVVLATHAARVPEEFVSTFGLTQPGAAVTLWVYVVTEDGNERGSAKMVVRRPE
jgi:hypothetical protein